MAEDGEEASCTVGCALKYVEADDVGEERDELLNGGVVDARCLESEISDLPIRRVCGVRARSPSTPCLVDVSSNS